MCTAMTLRTQSQEQFFGRTMDFSYEIMPRFYVIPAGYEWNSSLGQGQFTDGYRFIGLGQYLDGMLGFFDGVNERGFAAAVLYFAGYAQYDENPGTDTVQVASTDFLHYLLGRCAAVEELPDLLKNVNVIGMVDPITQTVAPLHWITVDKSGACTVIEPTEQGLKLYDNSLGVMANSPGFEWHMTNLRNYAGVVPTQQEETSWGDEVLLHPFGQAQGTAGLPGGFTSPARFVRTAYLKTHIPTLKDSQEAAPACFRIMESVSIPKGAVVTGRGTDDYTRYTAFINVNTGEYFYKAYNDLCVVNAGLWDTP